MKSLRIYYYVCYTLDTWLPTFLTTVRGLLPSDVITQAAGSGRVWSRTRERKQLTDRHLGAPSTASDFHLVHSFSGCFWAP